MERLRSIVIFLVFLVGCGGPPEDFACDTGEPTHRFMCIASKHTPPSSGNIRAFYVSLDLEARAIPNLTEALLGLTEKPRILQIGGDTETNTLETLASASRSVTEQGVSLDGASVVYVGGPNSEATVRSILEPLGIKVIYVQSEAYRAL
tara:strand:+ start:255 stop:701 length:447 start_codon:yes stop_codon:yes gene_type:complete